MTNARQLSVRRRAHTPPAALAGVNAGTDGQARRIGFERVDQTPQQRLLDEIIRVEEHDVGRRRQLQPAVADGAGAAVGAGLPADAVAEALDDVEAGVGRAVVDEHAI
jgi:hypothetical protein